MVSFQRLRLHFARITIIAWQLSRFRLKMSFSWKDDYRDNHNFPRENRSSLGPFFKENEAERFLLSTLYSQYKSSAFMELWKKNHVTTKSPSSTNWKFNFNVETHPPWTKNKLRGCERNMVFKKQPTPSIVQVFNIHYLLFSTADGEEQPPEDLWGREQHFLLTRSRHLGDGAG